MKKTVLQAFKSNGKIYLRPFDEHSETTIKGFKPNQLLKANISGTRKERSYKQLSTYMDCCGWVADNKDDETKESIDFEVRVQLRHLKGFKVINGVAFALVDSISYDNLEHLEACNYFGRAFPVLAKMVGLTVDEMLRAVVEAKEAA
jgi:hypothetical protein